MNNFANKPVNSFGLSCSNSFYAGTTREAWKASTFNCLPRYSLHCLDPARQIRLLSSSMQAPRYQQF